VDSVIGHAIKEVSLCVVEVLEGLKQKVV
jgi:hypothetical protein